MSREERTLFVTWLTYWMLYSPADTSITAALYTYSANLYLYNGGSVYLQCNSGIAVNSYYYVLSSQIGTCISCPVSDSIMVNSQNTCTALLFLFSETNKFERWFSMCFYVVFDYFTIMWNTSGKMHHIHSTELLLLYWRQDMSVMCTSTATGTITPRNKSKEKSIIKRTFLKLWQDASNYVGCMWARRRGWNEIFLKNKRLPKTR